MLYFSRWMIAFIITVCLGAVVFTLPNLWPGLNQALPQWAQLPRMPLGLDLRGGTHLLYEMDTAQLRREWLESIAVEARRSLREDRVAHLGVRVVNDQVRATIRNPEQTEQAFNRLRQIAQPVSSSLFAAGTGLDVNVTRAEGNTIILQPSEAGLTERINTGVGRAIETIRRRVDPDGTTEALIQRQGQDRILIQVPGREPDEVKELVGRTARLTFQLVDQSLPPEEAAQGRMPVDSMLVPSQENPGQQLLLFKEAVVTGDELVDAQLGFDSRTSEPVVNFRFNATGARRFGQITRDNVGRPFAIVLDNQVISAPVIREPILGGTGQISGSFTPQDATRLALLLRSGALPASLEIVEERSVGPSLGADSIEAGLEAAIVGFILVSVVMIAGYGIFGVFAVFALIINVALIMAALSLLQATLTLPGIAGIVLTMGVAVDANVLIYERIREELASGKPTITAVDTGFTRAYGTIVDANLTGLLAAVILYALGSGPVRGFAVTLSLGIIASMFTAITVTRLMAAEYIRRKRPATLEI
jgi:protein-export membrane protein SecD